jgi:predicted dehydrogenase
VRTLKIAIIGCGGVTLQNHLPGLALCPHVTVTALCDTDAATLERARQASGVVVTSNRYEEIVSRDDVHAVIIATPNVTHGPIAVAAFAHGKHVLCEKPLALAHAEAKAMADAGDRAGVRHMTAFTYRFVPAMRYLAHLVRRGDLGEPYHYRSCRLQDWGTRDLGRRGQRHGLRGRTRPCAHGLLALVDEDVVAHGHALVADVRRGARDELAHAARVLPAEGAARGGASGRDGAVHAESAFFLRFPGLNTWSTMP